MVGLVFLVAIVGVLNVGLHAAAKAVPASVTCPTPPKPAPHETSSTTTLTLPQFTVPTLGGLGVPDTPDTVPQGVNAGAWADYCHQSNQAGTLLVNDAIDYEAGVITDTEAVKDLTSAEIHILRDGVTSTGPVAIRIINVSDNIVKTLVAIVNAAPSDPHGFHAVDALIRAANGVPSCPL